eukprot:8005955-Karenia_brevis.AAC.1
MMPPLESYERARENVAKAKTLSKRDDVEVRAPREDEEMVRRRRRDDSSSSSSESERSVGT